jgi:alcohol dehydrogenase class IV
MRFEFATATRIIFGAGVLNEIGKLASEMGSRALVVSSSPQRAAPLIEKLSAAGIASVLFLVDKEPEISTARDGADIARANQCDLVIGFGGGSAIDTGKAVAALATNPGDPLDYLEVVGQNKPLTEMPLPFIAIPTTAGTGSEVTRNAVLASPEHHVKVSMRSPMMLPRLALVDPELSYSLPPAATASTGMDALTQVIEPFVAVGSNPMTDAICREGIRRARSLQRAYMVGDPASRESMALAALFGGLALANAKLGAVHGIAGPLGGMYPIPHGVACARLLPFVMEANIRALQARDPEGQALQRYNEVAYMLTGHPDVSAIDGASWVSRLATALFIPPLSEYGVRREDFGEIIEKSQRASSMKGNPIVLTDAELEWVLSSAL